MAPNKAQCNERIKDFLILQSRTQKVSTITKASTDNTSCQYYKLTKQFLRQHLLLQQKPQPLPPPPPPHEEILPFSTQFPILVSSISCLSISLSKKGDRFTKLAKKTSLDSHFISNSRHTQSFNTQLHYKALFTLLMKLCCLRNN